MNAMKSARTRTEAVTKEDAMDPHFPLAAPGPRPPAPDSPKAGGPDSGPNPP